MKRKKRTNDGKKQEDEVTITEKEDDGKFYLHLVLFPEFEFLGFDYMKVSGLVSRD